MYKVTTIYFKICRNQQCIWKKMKLDENGRAVGKFYFLTSNFGVLSFFSDISSFCSLHQLFEIIRSKYIPASVANVRLNAWLCDCLSRLQTTINTAAHEPFPFSNEYIYKTRRMQCTRCNAYMKMYYITSRFSIGRMV